MISAKTPGAYFAELAAKHGADFDEILASNLIPPIKTAGLIENEIEWFIHVRSEYIARRLNALCKID